MCVPLLLVLLRVIRDEGDGQLLTPATTKYVFFHHVLTNDHAINRRLYHFICPNKTNIDRVLITRVLALAGTHPSTVLLAFMGVSHFASMWISDVAAPTQCFTLIRPILRTLTVLGIWQSIALAANIGGQSSLISSPQNIIALQAMDPSPDWTKWFAVALPVSAGQKRHSKTCDSGGCAEFYTTFAVLSITWLRLAVGILVSTQAPHEGNFKRYSDGEAGVWCHGMSVTSDGIAFLTAISGSSPSCLRIKVWKR
ncbi:uncharacterized protein LACBIDRAFT_314306 [Laccaria bicolor S238N-H82]|uniref:Predicted protein n=1 Tax=Laccaria bicolor (strain S238N-H82 / ATCC MYA-4686) TaxID=486041 RepID=B0DY92_LACBS|nr:uncharacterized protein LACBIDRAFT_314306 [Laccaria bicolor S238N-H82]EDR00393.1 predicted protein [Laccaria bicolor S238N-H82]|eukprot:XP_001888952.1 predicted protein [Laccaria bicolor S238N-H82]